MNSNNRNIPSDNDDGSFLAESYSQAEGGHDMDSGSWRHPHEESYDDEYVEGTHYSLSTVTEEDSQQVELTGTESQRGMSPSDFSFSTFNFNERAGTSPAPSRGHRAPGEHDDSPLRSPVLSFGTEKHPTQRISPQDSSSSLTPSPLPDTIEAHDILFAQETAGMLHYRTELEGSVQAGRSAVNESLTDDTEWRINFANMALQAEQQHAPEVELCISPSLPSSSAVSISTGPTSISASKLASTSAEIALERVSASTPTQPTSVNAQAMLTQKVQHLGWKMEGEEDVDCGNGIDSGEGDVTTGRQEDREKDLAESILVLESDRHHQSSEKTNATLTDIASSVRATEPTEIASIVGVLQKVHANELKGQVEAIVLHMAASDHPPSLPAAASHRTTSCTVCMSREQEAQTTEATMMARENEKHPVELFEIIHKQVHAMVHVVANEVMRLEGSSTLQLSLEIEKSGTEGENHVLGMDMVERVQEQQQLLTLIEMASQEDEGFLTEIVGDQLQRRLAGKQRMLEGELEHESHGQHGDIVSGRVSGMPARLNLEVDIDMDDYNDLMTPQSMASSTRSEIHHQMTFRTKLASQIIKKNTGETQKDHIMLEQRVAEQRVGEILEQHVSLLVSTCAAISRNIEGIFAVTQQYGSQVSDHLKNAESLVQCVEVIVDRVQDELTSKVKELKSQIKAKTKALQEVTEELSIARAMSQDAGKISLTVADGPVPNPVSEDSSMVKDVKKIEDATASEVQRLKNKLQHVNNTIVQHEKKMNGLERNLATSQNLARQREEESNRLKDRMYENEADARRKIERLTTYTQNLIKDIEKKELQVDQKKADIMLLHQKLEEKEKEIGKAQEESKQVRIESRHQLLAIENKLRKSIEAHQVIKEELSVTRTENSKKIMTLEETIATQLEQIEASNKLIKLQQIEIQALKAREEELSGGTANARSQLSYFVNKAIDAGKQSTDYKQQFNVSETALNQARELIKSLRKAKSNLEASLRATLNQQAELQKHLDQALHTIEDLKLDIAQLDSERLGTNRLLDLAYKNHSVIESEIAQNTANHAKHIDERDAKIALLQSKQTVAEMREGKLSRQVQELSQTRDTLSRDLHRCSSDLKGSKDCLEALRSEKDALECILQANKVIEKGYQHRAINFEKALSSGALAIGGTVQQKEVGLAERWAGDGGAAKSGIPYRFECENRSNEGENKMRAGIVKRGVQGSSKKAEGVAVECGTEREIDDDSFFKGNGPALSPVLDITVLCGSEDVGRRNVSPPIEGSKVVGGRTHTYAQGANTHATALVPKPPSHQKHAQDYSKRNPEFSGKGGQRSSERETARPRETEREDWGPRAHRLHPISVSDIDGGGRREDARGGGPLTGIGNMLSDDLLYYQRLVRGSGAS